MPDGLPLLKPPYSRMTAIDLNTGEHIWMTPTGNGDRFARTRDYAISHYRLSGATVARRGLW